MSHKKRKTTAAEVKKANASLRKSGAKKIRLADSTTIQVSAIPAFQSTSSSVAAPTKNILPPNFDLLTPKQNAFGPVRPNNILMDTRTIPGTPKDMLFSIWN